MDGYNEIFTLGAVMIALITIISFVTAISKLTEPVNKLNLAIQELRDLVKAINEQNETQNRRLDEHGKAIDQLNIKFEGLKTQVNIYHKN